MMEAFDERGKERLISLLIEILWGEGGLNSMFQASFKNIYHTSFSSDLFHSKERLLISHLVIFIILLSYGLLISIIGYPIYNGKLFAW